MEEKEKVKLYQKWWLWVIIGIISSIVITLIIILSSGINLFGKTSETNANNQIEEKKIENPYKITKDFDGMYKFTSKNDSGYSSTSLTGVITFNDGKCKVKYQKNNDESSNDLTKEYDGFCGINEEDNSTFYFTLNAKNNNGDYEEITYQCIQDEKNFSCKSKSKFNFSGYTNNHEFTLIYLGQSYDLDTSLKQVLNEEKIRIEEEKKLKEEQEKQAFLSSCQTYTFEQLARNPDNFKGTNVKLTGEVVQVMEGVYSNSLRVNITKEGKYTTYYKDTIYVNYVPKEGEDKILEDDIITIYGTAQGDYSYTSTMGATITLPFVDGKYIIINK